MLRLSGIGKRYGRNAVLRGISLTASTGEAVRVCGPNGSGKSTLLSIIAGFGLQDAGTCDITAPLSYVGHQPGLYGELSAARNIGCFDLDMEITSRWIKRLELQSHLEKKVQHLSRGTQQKLALILQFASRSPLWVADEPFNALDMESVEAVTEGYLSHLNDGGTLIWVSHGPRPALDAVSRTLDLVL